MEPFYVASPGDFTSTTKNLLPQFFIFFKFFSKIKKKIDTCVFATTGFPWPFLGGAEGLGWGVEKIEVCSENP